MLLRDEWLEMGIMNNTQTNTNTDKVGNGTLHNEALANSYKTFESREITHDYLTLAESVKVDAAALMTTVNAIPVAPGNNEAGRYVSLARTEIESAVMWATKAISRISQ